MFVFDGWPHDFMNILLGRKVSRGWAKLAKAEVEKGRSDLVNRSFNTNVTVFDQVKLGL